MIGCRCRVCRSADARDMRLRPSLLLAWGGKTVIIDTSPDLREQSLRHGLRRVDAVLYTHTHNDHVGGLDDLRRYNEMTGTAIPCYGSPATLRDIRRRFRYVFVRTQPGGIKPKVQLRAVTGPFTLFGRRIEPLRIWHGSMPILGYRAGNLAYLTDCNRIPAPTVRLIEGVDTLIIDALRRQWHPTHFTLDEALEQIRLIRPRRAYLTHICHDLPHAKLETLLPPHVRPAYDGLTLDIRP